MNDWRNHIDDSERTAPARVRGTGVEVEVVLELLAKGLSFDELRSRFDGLSEDSVRACIDYGRELMERRRELAIVRQRDDEVDAHPERVVSSEELERQLVADEAAEGFLPDDEP